ncbi:hypothetical protein AG0111_0g12099 [Alternaria gaisen]|uniref:Uncharacterized protein n=1 Tax=Alternaria gaisen TaxID=167740 RepID=A0ACB6F5A7_9PLEO|nr:hypothetical protein AG0111_0g12099 [Alternaria gaisen]
MADLLSASLALLQRSITEASKKGPGIAAIVAIVVVVIVVIIIIYVMLFTIWKRQQKKNKAAAVTAPPVPASGYQSQPIEMTLRSSYA